MRIAGAWHALGLLLFEGLLLALEALEFLFELLPLSLGSLELLDREPLLVLEPLDLGLGLGLARARCAVTLLLLPDLLLERDVPVSLLLRLFELPGERPEEDVRALGTEGMVEVRAAREKIK